MSRRMFAGLAVEISGEGAAVICVHGLGGTSNSFTPQLPVLASLRAIRPDLPCAGRSPNSEAPSVEGMAKALARLADALEVKAAHFIGHSLGSLICQHLAAERPELVRSLVLLGAIHEPSAVAREALRRRAEAARTGGLAEIADSITQNTLSAETRSRQPLGVAFVRESVMRQSPEGYARLCDALAEARAADHQRIKCSVMIINGEEDVIAPPSMARVIAERIAGATLITLPRCGHWPTIERVEEVNNELRGFLSRQKRPGGALVHRI